MQIVNVHPVGKFSKAEFRFSVHHRKLAVMRSWFEWVRFNYAVEHYEWKFTSEL